MDEARVEHDLTSTLLSEAQIQARLQELAREIEADYEGKDLLIVGVLKGAVMVMADLVRALDRHVAMDWMAVSSYGSGTTSSGVVRWATCAAECRPSGATRTPRTALSA